jgi:hypothetical protein
LDGGIERLSNVLGGFVKKAKDNAESPESHFTVIDGFIGIHFCRLPTDSLKIILQNLRAKAASNENNCIQVIGSRKEGRYLTG